MEELKFNPTSDYIIFEVPKVSEKTESGIIKSTQQIEKEKEESRRNKFLKILKVGPETKLLKPGNEVIMDGTARTIELEGITYGVCREYNVVLYR